MQELKYDGTITNTYGELEDLKKKMAESLDDPEVESVTIFKTPKSKNAKKRARRAQRSARKKNKGKK